jgi:N-acetylglucosaminyl-diphospho-decaprenol L-rhamnosyltransferase
MFGPLPMNTAAALDVSIVIVAYNSADMIGQCIDSLLGLTEAAVEIFVADNASADESVAMIRNRYPAVTLIENTTNRGFGAANNQVLPKCRGRYLLFLNPDTMVTPGSLVQMIAFMDRNPQIGLAGPRLANPDGTPQESVSYRYLGQKYAPELFTGLKGTIAWVMGASMIARAGVIRQVGGFDERFFLYGEEEDLCLRLRRAGYELGFIDTAVVVHVGGHSEKASPSYEVWRRKFLAEYVFYRKHYPPDVIRRITRDHRLKALWRIATIRLMKPFTPDRDKSAAKLIKYRAIYDTLNDIDRSPAVTRD